MEAEDEQILREYPVDFISLSYYNGRCVRADGRGEASGGNVFASAKNPYIPVFVNPAFCPSSIGFPKVAVSSEFPSSTFSPVLPDC